MQQAQTQQILMGLPVFPMRPIQRQKHPFARSDDALDDQLSKDVRRQIAAEKTLQTTVVTVDLSRSR